MLEARTDEASLDSAKSLSTTRYAQIFNGNFILLYLARILWHPRPGFVFGALQLFFWFGPMCSDSLHESKARILHGLEAVFLVLLKLLVRLLKPFESCFPM